MSKDSLLSISNLTVKFGGLTALDDVFLNLDSNQVNDSTNGIKNKIVDQSEQQVQDMTANG